MQYVLKRVLKSWNSKAMGPDNTLSDPFSCIFPVTIFEQQKICSVPRPDLRQRRSSSISSRNSNIASACLCVFSQVTFLLFGYLPVLHSKLLYLIRYRPVWNQPSPILHQKSLSTMYSNLWIWWVTIITSTSVEIDMDMQDYSCGQIVKKKSILFLFSETLFHDHYGKHHVEVRCEDKFIRNKEKKTTVIKEGLCWH